MKLMTACAEENCENPSAVRLHIPGAVGDWH